MDIEQQRFGNLELEGRIEDAIMMPLEAIELMHRGVVEMWDLWASCLVCMAAQPQIVARSFFEAGKAD